MKTLFKIALRNIGRHRRRTFLSAITIAAGLMFFIILSSILSGVDNISIRNMINLTSGSLKIQTIQYDKEKNSFPLNYGLDTFSTEIINQIIAKKVGGYLTKRTLFVGQLSNYAEPIPIIGTVVNETTDTSVFKFKSCIEGAYFDNDNMREIILGKRLAQDLGANVGDEITLYALTKYSSRNADRFKIVGLLNTGDLSINKGAVFITYNAANDFLDLENTVTELDVSVSNIDNINYLASSSTKIKNEIQEKCPSLKVSTFLELGEGVLKLAASKRKFGIIFMLIILIIGAVGIFNTVFMSVYERIREIGVLRALGLKPNEISYMFFIESLLTGILGSLLGILLGSLFNLVLVIHGIGGQRVTAQFGIAGNIYGTWNISEMITVFIFGILLSSLAGSIPARRASKFQVLTALRFQ